MLLDPPEPVKFILARWRSRLIVGQAGRRLTLKLRPWTG